MPDLPKVTIQVLSIDDAARFLKVSTKTLRRWEAAGKLLPTRTVGGHRRYILSDLADFKRKIKEKKDQKNISVHALRTVSPIVVTPTTNPQPTHAWIQPAVVRTVIPPLQSVSPILPTVEATADFEEKQVLSGKSIFSLQKIALDRNTLFKISIFSLILVSLMGAGHFVISSSGTHFAPLFRGFGSKAAKVNSPNQIASKKTDIGSVLAEESRLDTLSLTVNVPLRVENDIITTQKSVNLFNENAQTLQIGGAATTITLGATEGSTQINNSLNVKGTSNDIAGSLNLSGNTLTSTGDLTLDATGGGVKVGTGTPNAVDLTGDDLYVTGDLEVDGTSYIPTLSINGDTFTDLTGTGLSISAGALTATLGTSIDSAEISNDTIKEEDLAVSNSASNGYALTYNSSTGGFTWTDLGSATAASGFTDDGTLVRLSTSTDNLTIGSATNLAKVGIDGDTDEIQLLVQGNSTQTSNLLVVENSAGTDLFSVGNTGTITVADGSLLDLSAITHNDAAPQGLKLPQTDSFTNITGGGEGYVAWDTTENALKVFNGTTWANVGGAFTLTADTGTNQSLNPGDTIALSGGTNGIDTVVGATDTVTFNLDTTEIGSTTFGASAGITWTFDASAGTDTTIAFGNDTQTFTTGAALFSGDVTVQGGDLTLGSTTQDGSLTIYNDGATDYINLFQTSSSQSQDITYTLPPDDGTSNYVLTTNGAGVLTWTSVSGIGGMTSFNLVGDSGTPQSITDSNNATIVGGTNGIDTVASATDTLTLNLDTTEVGTTTWGSGTGFTWTFDSTANDDPGMTFGSDSISFNATTATFTGTGNVDIEGYAAIGNGSALSPDSGLIIDYDRTYTSVGQQLSVLGTVTGAADTNVYGVNIDPESITIPTGTTALAASLYVDEPNLTATGTLTNAASVYIAAAPTEAATNYALWVDSGAVQFDGSLTLGANGTDGQLVLYNELGATDYTNTFNLSDTQNANITYTLPPNDGATNQILSTNGSGVLTWIDVSGGAGNFWTDGGDVTYLTSQTDDLAVGGTDATSNLFFDESASALSLNPYGTSTGNTGEIRFTELVANGTNYTGFKAADSLAGNVIYTLPTADAASANQVLSSNGTGGLSWINVSAGAGNLWTDGGAYVYPTSGEYVGNNTSDGTNKVAGVYLADGAPLTIGTTNDFSLLYDAVTDNRLELSSTNQEFAIALGNQDVVISGSAEGTAALTLTAGDLAVSDGDLTVTAGETSLTTPSTTADSKALTVSHTGNITGTGYGTYSTVTGTSTTNVAGYFNSINATNNYALVADGATADLAGSTTAGGNLLLMSTTNATKGDIQFNSSSYYITSDGALITSSNESINGIDINSGAISDVTDFDAILTDGNTASIVGDNSPTADLLKLGGTDTSATDGVDGLVLTLGVSAASGDLIHLTPSYADATAGSTSETFNVINVDAFTATQNALGDTGLIRGLNIGNLTQTETQGTLTANALNIGTGWDDILNYNGTTVINGTGQIVSTQVSGILFSNSADSNAGTNTVVQGDTVAINGGTNGIDTSLSNDTYTLNFDSTEVGTTTWNAGATDPTWTFNTSGATDPTLAFANSSLTIGSAATIATDQTTLALFNTTATTIDFGGAATTALNIGNGSGNFTAINLGSGSGTHTINIAGTGATAADTVNIATGGTGADTINIGSSASTTAFNVTTGTGAQTFTSNVATGTTTTSGFVFDATAINTGTGMYVTTDSITQGKLLQLATTGNTLTTGTLFDLSTTATSLTGAANVGSLANIDWSPGSATTAAGDLFRINIGTNGTTTGDLFTIQDTSSDLFSVNEAQITSALPHAFTAAGDVTMAYDLQFTNQTASFIKSKAPLTLDTGESFESNDLTLQVYNAGSVVVGHGSTSTTSTTGLLDINALAGDAAVVGADINLTQNDGATAGTDATALNINLTANDADGDNFGITLTANATANAAAGSYEALLKLVNAENTAGAVTDGILIDSTSATDTDITDAIDVSDTNIVNAINIGANYLLGDGIRQFSSSSTVWTIEDTAGNDLMTITDNGTNGNVTVTSDLAVNGGDITTAGGENIDLGEATADTTTFYINSTAELLLNATNLTPGAAEGNTLGSATAEWDQLFLGDDAGVSLGLDQDWSLLFDQAGDNRLELTTAGTTGMLISSATVSGTGLLTTFDSVTTGTGATFSLDALTSGTGVLVESAGNSQTLSGDLFKINIGANVIATGNLFNVTDNNSSLFAVGETQIVSALPHAFTAAGDVAMAYDLQFTNQTASFIKSNAPLAIQAGESFENNNLSLQTYGTGNVVVDPQGTGYFMVNSTSSSVTGTTATDLNVAGAYITTNDLDTISLLVRNANAGAVTMTNVGTAGAQGDPGVLTVEGTGSSTTVYNLITAYNSLTRSDAAAVFRVRADGNVYGEANFNTSGADMAEYFEKEEDLIEGDIVGINPATGKVRKARTSDTLIGALSQKPGFVGNRPTGKTDEEIASQYGLVGLVGQIPVRVSTANGKVSPGDPIAVDTIPGVGVKASPNSQIIGHALEAVDQNNDTNMVMVAVSAEYYLGDLASNGNLNATAQTTPSSLVSATENTSVSTDVNDKLAALETKQLALESNIASISAQLAEIKLNASNSASLALDLPSNVLGIATSSATISENVSFLGKTTLSETVIADTLRVGLMTFDDMQSSIQSVAQPLKFQPDAFAGVEFVGAKLTIDKNGNVTTEGTITATKVNIAVPKTPEGEISNHAIGEGILLAGKTQVMIQTSAVTKDSKIFTTPKTTTGKQPLIISTIVPSEGFIVSVEDAIATDIEFDWWIVDKVVSN